MIYYSKFRRTFLGLLIAAVFLCLGLFTPSTLAQDGGGNTIDDVKKETLDLNPFELTSKNFANTIKDGNLWLIEFYTPWCRHCQEFGPTYSRISSAFHSNPKENIRVAKVNGQTERALTNRFGITGFPTFYVVDGYSVYEFTAPRSQANLMDFVRGGYKKQVAIPFWVSPMGPIGIIQEALISVTFWIVEWVYWIENYSGLSPILAGMIICGMAIFGGMFSIVLLTVLTTPRAKID